MDASIITIALFVLNIVLGLTSWALKRAVDTQDQKMSAIVVSLDDYKKQLHLLEVELPRTYATKQELLNAQSRTEEYLKSMQRDMTQVLVALGVKQAAA